MAPSRGWRRCAFLFLFGVVTLVAPGSRTQETWWPLPANFGITSSFGEFRPYRFHTGVDFSTNLRLGYPVRVWKEGRIVRLRVDRRGYGNALYVQHPDGSTTVYAHLDRFENRELGLMDRVAELRERRRTWFPGDAWLDPPIPVRAGQVIGYSGESGAGLPHLHWELRDADQRPRNPMGAVLRDRGDRQRPVVQGLIWVPATPRTLVNGRPAPWLWAPFSGDRSPVVITGPVHLYVAVYDPTFRPYRRAPARVTVDLDDRSIYLFQPDRVAFTDQWRAGWVYDYAMRGPRSWPIPLRITGVRDAPPGFVDRALRGPLDPEPGRHRLRIRVYDYQGHHAEVALDLVRVDLPTVAAAWGAQEVVFTGPTPDAGAPTWWVEVRSKRGPWKAQRPDRGRVHISWSRGACLEFRVGFRLEPVRTLYRPVPGTCTTGAPAEALPRPEPFGLRLPWSGQEQPGFWCPRRDACSRFLSWNWLHDPVRPLAPTGPGRTAARRMEVLEIRPATARRVRWDRLEWRISPRAVGEPTRVFLFREPPHDVPPGLVPVSDVYRFEPADLPFREPQVFRWRAPAADGPLGIFWFHPRKRTWVFGGAFPDHPLELVTYYPKTLLIARDQAPPRIEADPQLRWDPAAAPLRIPVREIGFGVREDRLAFFWDGERQPVPQAVQFDPDWPAVVFRPPQRPDRGEHRVDLVVEDWAGNRVRRSFTVRVR